MRRSKTVTQATTRFVSANKWVGWVGLGEGGRAAEAIDEADGGLLLLRSACDCSLRQLTCANTGTDTVLVLRGMNCKFTGV